MDFDSLDTEKRNPSTMDIDKLSTPDLLALIQREDEKVAVAVKLALPQIAAAVDGIVAALRAGGRLIYVGAGTSGRLGVLDAAECPPTFGTDPRQVQALLAGGRDAMFQAVEGAEDDAGLGADNLRDMGLVAADVVVGLAASGRTPYVVGALRYAAGLGCTTIAVSCTAVSEVEKHAKTFIHVSTGPEVITGSTRLKAGTAQKMILNMLSTASMIKLGKTYGNLMVDVKATNAKLMARVKRIVREATNEPADVVDAVVQQAGGSAKLAIVILLAHLSAVEAKRLLDIAGGSVHRALELANSAGESPAGPLGTNP